MSIAKFKESPWKASHEKYKASPLSITPAPEYASSEVLIASLYRTIGFPQVKEPSVPQVGRELDRKIQKLRDKQQLPPIGAKVSVDTWHTIVHGVLESPKLPNQSSKRFLQVTPLVPSSSLFSGSARLAGNSWHAGALIRRMVWLGSENSDVAMQAWQELFGALSIDKDDDIFARWLEEETAAWTGSAGTWRPAPVRDEDVANLAPDDYNSIAFLPARQFVRDLKSIIQAKCSMTRRQWTSLLESVLRLATVSHVTWLCDVQSGIWSCLQAALIKGEGPSTPTDAREMIFPSAPQYMPYGGKALHKFKDKASSYLRARLGINAVLWALEEIGATYDGFIATSADVHQLCEHIRQNRKALAAINTWEIFLETVERENRALLCKRGIGSNLHEFARHVLGQRQAAVHLLRGYDQGFILKKKGTSNASPWIVSLGPVAVLAFVHCALSGMGGPRSIHRLGQHLAAYGVVVDRHDIGKNDLGYQLRMLGLVLDSPDAESGMLLLPPFPTGTATQGTKS